MNSSAEVTFVLMVSKEECLMRRRTGSPSDPEIEE